MQGIQQIMAFIGAFLFTVGFAFFTPWPAYALAPAILAPFSVLLIVGLGILSVICPVGPMRQRTQYATILLSGVFVASLMLLNIVKAS